jgi:hypothetical protein
MMMLRAPVDSMSAQQQAGDVEMLEISSGMHRSICRRYSRTKNWFHDLATVDEAELKLVGSNVPCLLKKARGEERRMACAVQTVILREAVARKRIDQSRVHFAFLDILKVVQVVKTWTAHRKSGKYSNSALKG